MKLSALTDQLTIEATTGADRLEDPEVKAICYDSRKVVPGTLFVAIDGLATDGHRFIPDAVQRGAVAVVCQKPTRADAVVIRVTDSRAALAHLACRFYGQNHRHLPAGTDSQAGRAASRRGGNHQLSL